MATDITPPGRTKTERSGPGLLLRVFVFEFETSNLGVYFFGETMNQNLECGIWDKEGICLVPIADLDLQKRRAAPMPPEIAAKFDAKLAADRQLNWEAPVSGVIRV